MLRCLPHAGRERGALGRVAAGEVCRGYVARDDGSSGDDGSISDGDAFEDDGTGSDEAVGADGDGATVFFLREGGDPTRAGVRQVGVVVEDEGVCPDDGVFPDDDAGCADDAGSADACPFFQDEFGSVRIGGQRGAGGEDGVHAAQGVDGGSFFKDERGSATYLDVRKSGDEGCGCDLCPVHAAPRPREGGKEAEDGFFDGCHAVCDACWSARR